MKKETRQLVGIMLMILSVFPFTISCIGITFKLETLKCIISFILWVILFGGGLMLFLFKTDKKLICFLLSLLTTLAFSCFSFSLSFQLFKNMQAINLLSITGLIFSVFTCLCFKKYYS